MPAAKTAPASCVEYHLEVEFRADSATVWKALHQDIGAWWLPDFHMTGVDSEIRFDVSPGGHGLFEQCPDGSFLQWYSVQCYLPQQKKIYLVGSVAPEFGGPSTSSLTLSLVESDGGCKLLVHDAHVGNVDEQTAESLHSGWQQLFGEGLRQFVEAA